MRMKTKLSVLFLMFQLAGVFLEAQFPRFRALAFFSREVEPAHLEFALDAIRFFDDLTIGDGFVLDTTSNMDDLLSGKLEEYSVLLMLNVAPGTAAQRESFRQYMEKGGGWFGFHAAAYNDRSTDWPWFLDFLGGGVFWRNNWPPMPAKLVVDEPGHPVTRALPATFTAPANEWYQWKPSPRESPRIEVLVSLSGDNYPYGLKDIIPSGDCPVVWTNRDYRMIYMNMGHGNRIFTDPVQNQLIISGFRWVVASDRKGNVFE
jgi:type 1 glutamine amidotransferase